LDLKLPNVCIVQHQEMFSGKRGLGHFLDNQGKWRSRDETPATGGRRFGDRSTRPPFPLMNGMPL